VLLGLHARRDEALGRGGRDAVGHDEKCDENEERDQQAAHGQPSRMRPET
jgi:hypothetical protein